MKLILPSVLVLLLTSSIVGCGKNDQSTSDTSATESVDKRDKRGKRDKHDGRKVKWICEAQFEDSGITYRHTAGSKASATSQALKACSHQNCRVTGCYTLYL